MKIRLNGAAKSYVHIYNSVYSLRVSKLEMASCFPDILLKEQFKIILTMSVEAVLLLSHLENGLQKKSLSQTFSPIDLTCSSKRRSKTVIQVSSH